MGCLPVPILESPRGGLWAPLVPPASPPEGEPGLSRERGRPGDGAGTPAGLHQATRRTGLRSWRPAGAPGKAQCATANSRGRLQSLLLAHLAHNFHIVYVRFVCSLWLFCPLFPASCGCVCKGAYTPWKRAPSAPERGSAASGGCETRRTGVRQRAAERSSRCATPATGPGARGFLYRKPGVGTGTDSRARSTGPEAAGAVTVAGLQGQGAVRTLSRGRSPRVLLWWGFHTALDARTALC